MNNFTFHNWQPIHISVPKIGPGLDFYGDALGLLVAQYRSEPTPQAELELPGTSTHLVLTKSNTPGSATLLVDDLDSVVVALVDSGAVRTAQPAGHDLVSVATVTDPFGNELHLIQLNLTATTSQPAGAIA